MTVMVALLRGVNVGGKGRLPMADLRAIAQRLGYAEVATYIQSGNLVLSSGDSPATVETDLAAAIAAGSSVQPAVMVRTRSQLARIVRGNPFLASGADEGHLHVVFMPGPAEIGTLDLAAYAPEEAVARATELYLRLPGGVGRSRLAADLARQKGSLGTMRSWRTVTRLLAMADEAAR